MRNKTVLGCCNLKNGYLDMEICAFSGDWLIVYDGKYNYMVFNCAGAKAIRELQRGRFPSNDVNTGLKYIEYFISLENALRGLLVILAYPEGFKKSDEFNYLWKLLKMGLSPIYGGNPFNNRN